MVRRSWFEGPAGPGDVHSLETTTVRASYGHGDNNFCVVWCRMTPWYGAAGIAQHPLHSAQCSEPVADVTLFRRNKSPKIHQPRFEGSSGLNFSNSAFLRPCQALNCSEPALWLWASFAEILGNNGEKKAGRFRVLTYLPQACIS